MASPESLLKGVLPDFLVEVNEWLVNALTLPADQ